MKYPECAEWIERSFLKWQASEGKRKTWRQFAEWLGVKPATLSQWLRGKARPNVEGAFALGKRFGIVAYQKAGLPLPDPMLFDYVRISENLSDAGRKELSLMMSKYKLLMSKHKGGE